MYNYKYDNVNLKRKFSLLLIFVIFRRYKKNEKHLCYKLERLCK